MQPGSTASRRLLLRASDLLKSKLRVKISQAGVHQCFTIQADSFEMQPGGTITIVVEFSVPDSTTAQNLQVLLPCVFPSTMITFARLITAIFCSPKMTWF
jgi:hypothetical protein